MFDKNSKAGAKPGLKIAIFETILEKGRVSPTGFSAEYSQDSTLRNNKMKYKNSYYSILKTMREMRDAKWIANAGTKASDRGNNQTLYEATMDGLQWYINNKENLTSDQLWTRLMNMPLENLIKLSEDKKFEEINQRLNEKFLGTSSEYYLPSGFVDVLQRYRHMTSKDRKFYEKMISGLEHIGENGPVISRKDYEDIIVKIHGIDFLGDYLDWRQLNLRGLVVDIHRDGENNVTLGPFGLILLFDHYFKKYNDKKDYQDHHVNHIFEETVDLSFQKQRLDDEMRTNPELVKRISTIVKNHSFLFPMIFLQNRWNKMASRMSIEELISIFINLYLDDTVDKFSHMNIETLRLIHAQNDMNSTINNHLFHHNIVSVSPIKNWLAEEKCSFPLIEQNNKISKLAYFFITAIKYVDYTCLKIVKSDNGFMIGYWPEHHALFMTCCTYTIDGEIVLDDDEEKFNLLIKNDVDEWNDRWSMSDDLTNEFRHTLKEMNEQTITDHREFKKKFLTTTKTIMEKYRVKELKLQLDTIERIFNDMVKIFRIKKFLIVYLEQNYWDTHFDLMHKFDLYLKNPRANQYLYSLQNVISFQFFTYLRSLNYSLWSELIEDDKKLEDWYDQWLKEINKFQKLS